MTPNAPTGRHGFAPALRLSLMTPWSRTRLIALRRTSRPVSMSSASLNSRDEKRCSDSEKPDQHGVRAPEQRQRSADIAGRSSPPPPPPHTLPAPAPHQHSPPRHHHHHPTRH